MKKPMLTALVCSAVLTPMIGSASINMATATPQGLGSDPCTGSGTCVDFSALVDNGTIKAGDSMALCIKAQGPARFHTSKETTRLDYTKDGPTKISITEKPGSFIYTFPKHSSCQAEITQVGVETCTSVQCSMTKEGEVFTYTLAPPTSTT